MKTVPQEHLTELEYLEREHAGEVKHEFINGEIVDMAGGSPAHALLTYCQPPPNL